MVSNSIAHPIGVLCVLLFAFLDEKGERRAKKAISEPILMSAPMVLRVTHAIYGAARPRSRSDDSQTALDSGFPALLI
eukprot:scaffold1084_cov29-Cyclotella_meneghiniana.AAC.2